MDEHLSEGQGSLPPPKAPRNRRCITLSVSIDEWRAIRDAAQRERRPMGVWCVIQALRAAGIEPLPREKGGPANAL